MDHSETTGLRRHLLPGRERKRICRALPPRGEEKEFIRGIYPPYSSPVILEIFSRESRSFGP